ncbi:MAG: GNAT family N-acetyltransferase [Candidatus Levybacteria bacterium]|nr:GNAT family N-acetyltransferase [Candidatus Levybacteria bacterium]
MKSTDLDFFVSLRNKCVAYLHDSRKFSLSDAKRWFKTTNPQYFVIEFEGSKVGYIRTSAWDLQNKNVYVGADIEPKYRKKGFAFEALKLFIDFLLREKKFNKVSLEVLDFNTPAISLYKKLGFKKEGVRRHHVKKGNRYVDSLIMGFLRADYLK